MNTGGSSVKRKLPFDSCGSPVPLSHKRPKGDRTISQQSVTSDSEENYHALDNSEMSIQENGETISPKMNDISIDDLLETFAGMTLPEREYEDCPVCGDWDLDSEEPLEYVKVRGRVYLSHRAKNVSRAPSFIKLWDKWGKDDLKKKAVQENSSNADT
eukprot:884483_1